MFAFIRPEKSLSGEMSWIGHWEDSFTGATTEKQEIHLRRPNSAEMISSKIFFQSLLLG